MVPLPLRRCRNFKQTDETHIVPSRRLPDRTPAMDLSQPGAFAAKAKGVSSFSMFANPDCPCCYRPGEPFSPEVDGMSRATAKHKLGEMGRDETERPTDRPTDRRRPRERVTIPGRREERTRIGEGTYPSVPFRRGRNEPPPPPPSPDREESKGRSPTRASGLVCAPPPLALTLARSPPFSDPYSPPPGARRPPHRALST